MKKVNCLNPKIKEINVSYLLMFVWVFTLTFLSCKKQNPVKEYGIYTDYYPLKIGSYFIYDVDSIFYNDFDNTIDTTYFRVKEAYTDTFYDNQGYLNYRLERFYQYKKKQSESYDTISSFLKDVWFVTHTPSTIQRVEENLRFINLTNPIRDGLSWDGNAHNILSAWEFEYDDFGKSHLEYENTVKVKRELDSNVINYEYGEQIFAKNIGLVEYYEIKVEDRRSSSDPLTPILERIHKGYQFHYKLNSYFIPE